MALNLNDEVETKPGAAHRELASHFYKVAEAKEIAAERLAREGRYDRSNDSDIEADKYRWKAHGHRVAAFIETAASKVGWDLKI